MTEKEIALTKEDHKRNLAKSLIKGLPYIGSSLDQLVYGNQDERRWLRLEKTLQEIEEGMKARKIPAKEILKEEFDHLLRLTAGKLGDATNEDKRERFRDLLLNSVSLPEGDREWESARLAGELLNQLEGPALHILSGLVAEGALEKELRTVLRLPQPQITNYHVRSQEQFDATEVNRPLDYEWAVVDAWMSRLVELKLISGQSCAAKAWTNVALTALGVFLTKWILAN